MKTTPTLRSAAKKTVTKKVQTKVPDKIENLAVGFGGIAADLKQNQDKLLAYARTLEDIVSEKVSVPGNGKETTPANTEDRITQLSADNEELRKQAEQLAKRNYEITLCSRMNDFLHSSTTEVEAYAIIAETVAQLFPGDSGAVFLLSASRDAMESAAVWGSLPPSNLDFQPSECWAYRRGQAHLVMKQKQCCPHIGETRSRHVCLPLFSKGDILGILHLRDGSLGKDPEDELRMDEKSQLAKRLADSIGLGIANLKLRESMRNELIRDPLTGLFNRRYMEENLAQEKHRTRRNKDQLAVIMIDIDHFKRFNDDFGHDGGDAILRTLGSFFKEHVRGSDIACRYGGEEFVLILSPSTAEGARQRAEKIREDAKAFSVKHDGQNLGAITLSLGVAMFPGHGADTAALLKAADVALYHAKHKGRDQVAMFTKKLQSSKQTDLRAKQ